MGHTWIEQKHKKKNKKEKHITHFVMSETGVLALL